jgi:exodeoxyribonuclease V beta subunit
MKSAFYKRPAILARPEFKKGHVVIEASAGTGKTYTLEHLVLDLIINNGAKIEEILVVTFTDAATRELRERVRELIRRVCDETGDLPAGADPESYWKINEATRSRLREALFRFDGAAISTIHGFCQRVLSEQAFLGGRLFEQEHADGGELFGLAFRETVRTALAETSPEGEMLRTWIGMDKTLNDLELFLFNCHREGCPQRCPVTPLWEPEQFYEAINGLPPLDQLKEAGNELFSNKNSLKTFNSHLEDLFSLASDIEDKSDLPEAAELFKAWAGKTRTLDKIKDSQIDNLRRAAGFTESPAVLNELAASLTEIEVRAAGLESFFVHRLLPRVQQLLAARKRALGLTDFDDMLLGVQEALAGPEAETLLALLRKRWKYALVDEFQDTDPVQWDIFRRLFVEGTDIHRLFIIGDPKQAIYSFRGADVHTYQLAREELIGKQNAGRVPLQENYRSTELLIDAVNKILTAADTEGKAFLEGLNSYNEPVECGDQARFAEENSRPAVPVHLVHLYGNEKGLNAKSIKHGIACFIAEEIGRLTGDKCGLLTGSKNSGSSPVSLSDIYILTRTGREGREIGQVLRSYGIAHAFYKQEGLFQTEEAESLHSLLLTINNPADPAARMSAWLTPFFDLPLKDLQAWRESAEGHFITSLLFEWKGLADAQAWAVLFDRILTGSGLVRRLVFLGNERALTNYQHLFELLLAEAHSRPLTLIELARSLKARIDGRKLPEGREGDIQRLETDRDAVQILTMHKAKGLEAEVVFIGGGFSDFRGGRGVKTGIYHSDSKRCLHIGASTGEIEEAIKQEVREENQRLIYVALTRAKSRLYLPYFGSGPADSNTGSYGYKFLGASYKALQKQLDLLREEGQLGNSDHFLLRKTSCLRQPPQELETTTTADGWPEEGLLEMPASAKTEADRLRPGRRGVILTSYTRIKQGAKWQPPAADDAEQSAPGSEEFLNEAPAETEIGLPGGRETGIFLHTLLENTVAAELQNMTLDEWLKFEPARIRFAATARRYGYDPVYLDEAMRLIYKALCSPVKAESIEGGTLLDLPGGFSSGCRQVTEMSFTYPIPESFHPLINGVKETINGDHMPFEAVRGYLQGLIDLVFEHEGRIYLLDWKSDRLGSYDRASLSAHVERNYSLQAQVYTLAVIRLLNLSGSSDYENRFGGIIYAFIRGMNSAAGSGAEGVWFSHPSANQATAWEEDLLNRKEWGGEVITLNQGDSHDCVS